MKFTHLSDILPVKEISPYLYQLYAPENISINCGHLRNLSLQVKLELEYGEICMLFLDPKLQASGLSLLNEIVYGHSQELILSIKNTNINPEKMGPEYLFGNPRNVRVGKDDEICKLLIIKR